MKTLEARSKKLEAGISVIAVTITLLLLILFAMGAASLVSVRANINAESVNAQRALYVAESGLASAKKTLFTDWSQYSTPASFPLTNFSGGTFQVVITAGANPGHYITATSTGIYGNSQRVIECLISRYSALDDAVYTTDRFVQFGSAVVNGSVTQQASDYPSLHATDAIAMAQANKLNGYTGVDGNYFRGDFTGHPNSMNGVMFIDTFSSGTPADCHLSGNLSTNNGLPAMLIILGDLKVTGTLVFNGLIYATGSADFSMGSVTINGEILSSSLVTEGGNATITYNEGNVINSNTLSLLDLVYRPTEKTWKIIN